MPITCLKYFLDMTILFINKCCVACNKIYNALRGIWYSLNNYTATNSSLSLHIPSAFNEYVTRQFKICCRGENDTFSNFNAYFRINLCFLTK